MADCARILAADVPSTSSNSDKNNMEDSNLSNYMCPICLRILVEPVSMPCKHEVCLLCLNETAKAVNRHCPVCRKRFGSWMRKTKANSQINSKLWLFIKETFPEELKKRSEDKDEALFNDEDRKRKISNPGELHQDYKKEKEKFEEETEMIRRKQDRASAELIQVLNEKDQIELEQERQRARDLAKQDELLAKALAKELEQEAAAKLQEGLRRSEKLAKKIQKKEEERAKRREEEDLKLAKALSEEINGKKTFSASDVKTRSKSKKITPTVSRSGDATPDSITEELTHFRPIRTAPPTPPKLQRILYQPRAIKIKDSGTK